jgi:hypothetical protein
VPYGANRIHAARTEQKLLLELNVDAAEPPPLGARLLMSALMMFKKYGVPSTRVHARPFVQAIKPSATSLLPQQPGTTELVLGNTAGLLKSPQVVLMVMLTGTLTSVSPTW